MSFITRCPSCGTAFRVVADQLKIADGWVRCGCCQHIFDATLDLQPALEPRVAPPVPQPGRAGEVPEAPPATVADPASTLDTQPADGAASTASLAGSSGREDGDADADASEEAGAPNAGGALAAGTSPASMGSGSTQPRPTEPFRDDGLTLPRAPQDTLVEAGETGSPPCGAEDDEPAFVRQARRRAFWRRPWVRAVLGVVALGLGAALVAQAAWIWRDEWAARHPALRPALQAFCATLDCQIAPPRRVQDVLIEGSVLLRRAPDRYSFHLVLRNQADVEVRAPALELTLLDAQEQVLVRRVWLPHEWPQPTTALGPRAEWPLQFELRYEHPQAARMAGYRAVLFYP